MIYFIRCECPGEQPIKIGFAQYVGERLVNLQIGCPFPLTILAVIEDGDEAQESFLHAAFDEFRLRGEWFRPNAELVEWIEQNARKPTKRDMRAVNQERAVMIDKDANDKWAEIEAVLFKSAEEVAVEAVELAIKEDPNFDDELNHQGRWLSGAVRAYIPRDMCDRIAALNVTGRPGRYFSYAIRRYHARVMQEAKK